MTRAEDLARTKPEALPSAPRLLIAFTRGTPEERETLLREYERIGAPPNNADYIATALRDFDVAEQLLRFPRSNSQRRADAHLGLAVIEVARGRWQAARSEFAQAERLDPGTRPILRALCASLPFLAVPREDVAAARVAIERWPATVADTIAIADSYEAALRPHLRLYLLGLLSSRLGEGDAALRYAAELERLPSAGAPRAAVASLAATVRADVLHARGELAEALRVLERARGEVPFELVYVPGFGEERARYLRAELLFALGRGDEALRWLEHGLAVSLASRAEFPYYAVFELRQAQIHEQLGDAPRAARHYARFLDHWRDADPALEPLLASARDGLRRTTTEASAR